jgi:hypothetical protein
MADMATIEASPRAAGRLPVSARWSEAGFKRADADAWRRAGWPEADDAARWRDASRADRPGPLRGLRDAGYTPDQLRATGRFVRRHLAAWTAAVVSPATGGPSLGRARAARAQAALDRISVQGGDTIIDLR